MSNINLTIIIPVYNTPIEALERLVESLVTQVDDRYKVIFINDGSDEETKNALNMLSKKIQCATVIHKENGGVSEARNVGIKSATTAYISFADADDVLTRDYVLKLNEIIDQYSVDIVYACIVKKPQGDTPKQSADKVDVFRGKEQLEMVKESLLGVVDGKLNYTILGTPCARAYKTTIAKKILFRVGINFYEDQIFNREFLEYAESAIVIPDIIYIYEQNDYSAMHRNRNLNFYEKTKAYWEVFFELNQKEDKKYKKSLRKEQLTFLYAVINYDYIYNKESNFVIYRKEIINIIKHPMLQDSISNLELTIKEDGFVQWINLKLLKIHAYSFLYFEKKLFYLLKKVRK